MKNLFCSVAVSVAVAMSGQAFAHDSSLEHAHRKDIKNKAIQIGGDLGDDLPGIYLWNVTGNNNDFPNYQNASGLVCGLYIMNKGHARKAKAITKGQPLTLDFTYEYDESKVMLAGKMTVSKHNGTDWDAPLTLKKGDLVNFHAGDRILFSTKGFAKAYYCGVSGNLGS